MSLYLSILHAIEGIPNEMVLMLSLIGDTLLMDYESPYYPLECNLGIIRHMDNPKRMRKCAWNITRYILEHEGSDIEFHGWKYKPRHRRNKNYVWVPDDGETLPTELLSHIPEFYQGMKTIREACAWKVAHPEASNWTLLNLSQFHQQKGQWIYHG